MDFYNDIEWFAGEWLENLMLSGEIPWGVVDRRSISDIDGWELQYRRVHFFAGIGGWAEALRIAEWPEDREVWTGSCPCQPFSSAGKRKGFNDERHLWPEFRRLIEECRPATIFGEQVASKDGRTWLAVVRADLEALGYDVGAADLCAAGVGAPHIRQRLFWVANTKGEWSRGIRRELGETEGDRVREIPRERTRRDGLKSGSDSGWMANSGVSRLEERSEQPAREEREAVERGGNVGGLANARYKQSGRATGPCQEKRGRTLSDSPGCGAWGNINFLPCTDGKARPIMPGIRLLAHGFPNRVGLLRGFGNAIVPQVAATFIQAFLDTEAQQ